MVAAGSAAHNPSSAKAHALRKRQITFTHFTYKISYKFLCLSTTTYRNLGFFVGLACAGVCKTGSEKAKCAAGPFHTQITCGNIANPVTSQGLPNLLCFYSVKAEQPSPPPPLSYAPSALNT